MTYNVNGQIIFTPVAGTSRTGLYNANGSYNVVLTTENTTIKGLYHPCGAYWGTVGTGVSYQTIDGSITIANNGDGTYSPVVPIGGSKTLNINWTAEGDSITIGLGGVPAWPYVALGTMPGATAPVAGSNNPSVSPVSGVGTVHLNDIATSGISAITIDQNYSTRAGAAYDSTKNVNILTLMIGTNTSGASDTTAVGKYFFIRDYLRKAQATGYNRVVIGTLIARDDDGGTFWTSTATPLNNFIRTLYNSDLRSDFLIDFGNDSRFNLPSQIPASPYYNTAVDFIHPSVLGEAAMGSIAEPAALLALQGSGTKILSPNLAFSPWDGNAAAQTPLGNSITTTTLAVASQCGTLSEFKSGKYHWEINVDTVGSGGGVGMFNSDVGFDVSSQSLYLGNSFVWSPTTGTAMEGAATAVVPGNYTTGDRLIFECDYSNPAQVLLWMRFDRSGTFSNWNGNASANPATRTLGLDITAIAASPGYLRPAVAVGTSAQYTLKFSAATFLGTPSTGFSAFGP